MGSMISAWWKKAKRFWLRNGLRTPLCQKAKHLQNSGPGLFWRMKKRVTLTSILWLVAALLALPLLSTGCASKAKIDWNSRVGSYTYDQAVLELGPPDKASDLTDGSKVADWFVKRNSRVSFGLGTGFSSGGTGVGVGQSVGSGGSAQFLRLTFNPEKKLQAWSHVNQR